VYNYTFLFSIHHVNKNILIIRTEINKNATPNLGWSVAIFSTIISNATYVSVNNSSQVFKIASALCRGLAMVMDTRHLITVIPAVLKSVLIVLIKVNSRFYSVLAAQYCEVLFC
jgi:hypothetical protein